MNPATLPGDEAIEVVQILHHVADWCQSDPDGTLTGSWHAFCGPGSYGPGDLAQDAVRLAGRLLSALRDERLARGSGR